MLKKKRVSLFTYNNCECGLIIRATWKWAIGTTEIMITELHASVRRNDGPIAQSN